MALLVSYLKHVSYNLSKSRTDENPRFIAGPRVPSHELVLANSFENSSAIHILADALGQ